MGVIIKNKKHYFTRFPLWLIAIIIVGVSPFVIGSLGGFLTEIITGEPCHEGNCFWGVIPWFGIFITLPIGSIVLLIYLIIIIIDSFKLLKERAE